MQGVASSVHMAARKSGLSSWEFPKGSGIKIREIVNVSSGQPFGGSYLVTVPARITGSIRARRQFPSKPLAEEWAGKQFAGHRKQGEDFFAATDSERRQFVECLPILRKHGIDLGRAVEFAALHLKPEGGSRSVDAVADEMIQSKELRYQRGDLRASTYNDFRTRARRFADAFDGRPVNELRKDEIKEWLVGLGGGVRTTKNYLSIVGEILKHAVESRYLIKSPLDYLTTNERKELCGSGSGDSEPAILTVDEARRLLEAARENPELRLLPAVALGLFCGIRTEELKRLRWSDIRESERPAIVTITSAIAKKRRIRHVDIPDNALSWLSLCEEKEGLIAHSPVNRDYQRRFRQLLKIAGFGGEDESGVWRSQWDANAMRHSFGTYHFALRGNSLETSRQLGHKASDQVLFDHYRALATKEQAERYFGLRPTSEGRNVAKLA